MSNVGRVVLAAAIGLACAVSAPPAQGGDARAELTRLFELGAKNTPPAVAGASQQQQLLRRTLGDDVRVDYAYGLVLAQQRRYDGAIPLVTRYLDARPADLSAWRVRIWAEMQDQRYDALLSSLAAVGKVLQKAPPPIAPEQVEAARFVGAAFAYLDRVRGDAIDAQRLAAGKQALVTQLADRYRMAWDEGRQSVTSRFEELQTDRAARVRGEELAAADKIKRTEAELAIKEKEARGEREVTQASSQNLKSAQRELGIIAQHLSSLGQDRARLTAQIITWQAQLSELQVTTSSQLPAVVGNRPNDPTPRAGDVLIGNRSTTSTRLDIGRYAQAQAIAVTLAGLNKQAFEIDREILALQTRAAELGDKGAQEAVRLAKSQQTAAKANKRATALEKQLQRSESQARPKNTALSGRMLQFSTYVPLPYEQESQRVLGWFAR